MNILDNISDDGGEPLSLDTLTAGGAAPAIPPMGTLKNRASLAAALEGDVSKASATYQGIIAEGSQGGSSIYDEVSRKHSQSEEVKDNKALIGILSDNTIPFEKKREAIENLRVQRTNRDVRKELLAKTLAEGSAGENPDEEKARVVTAAEMVDKIYEQASVQQSLVNAHGASLPSVGSSTGETVKVVDDFLAVFFYPFTEGTFSAKLAGAMAKAEGREATYWEYVKAFTFQAGSVKADARERLARMPPNEQTAYKKTILDFLQNNSGVLIHGDNSYNAYVRAVELFDKEGYGSGYEFADNVLSLVPIILPTVKLAKATIRSAKAAAPIPQTAPIPQRPTGYWDDVAAGMNPPKQIADDTQPVHRKASRQGDKSHARGGWPEGVSSWAAPTSTKSSPITEADLAKMPEPPVAKGESLFTPAGVDTRINAAQDEIASLLGEAGELADKGAIARMKKELAAISKPDTSESAIKARTRILQKKGMSYKEATKEATKQLNDELAEYTAKTKRLENQIETNRKASTVSQRIDALEKEIAALQKQKKAEAPELTQIKDAISRIEANSTVRMENPASVAGVFNQVNPQKARAAHKAVVDGGEEAAEALYGTSKQAAIASDVLPQVRTPSRAVTAKAPDIGRDVRNTASRMNPAIRELVRDSDAAIHFDLEELAKARAQVIRDYSSATDIVPIDSMGGFRVSDPKGAWVDISSVYGTKNGSWSNADEAITQTLFALRGQGAIASDVTLLKRDGTDYVVTTLEAEKGKSGSYLVELSMERELTAADILKEGGKMTPLDVRRNWLDRIPGLVTNDRGSVSRWLFDAASMLHPTITGSAAVATDIASRFEKVLYDLAARFSDDYNKLSKERKAEMDRYIRNANFNRIRFDRSSLIGQGFVPEEIEALAKWREYWDTVWSLENLDAVRTLDMQGYGIFKNGNAELFAKPISKNQNIPSMFDPVSGVVVKMDKPAMDALYASGGTIASLRRPAEFAGKTTEHMIVRNTPQEYIRKLRDTDSVVNYIEGYYQITYKAPIFIDEITYKADGVSIETRKAIAVSGNTNDAKAFIARQQTLNQGKTYVHRANNSGLFRDSDDWFDINSAAGRIAQKHRGKLLEDSLGVVHIGEGAFIADPVESAVRATRSVSGRTVMRPVLESAKARFLQQYAGVLPDNAYGGKKYPSRINEIGGKGMQLAKLTGDARTTWEYLRYLENGYINSMDEVVRMGFNAMATTLGGRGFRRLEEMALAVGGADTTFTGAGKGAVFTAYIGLNPVRQWFTQPHQIARTIMYNPQGWADPEGISSLLYGYLGNKLGTLSDSSKILSAVDELFETTPGLYELKSKGGPTKSAKISAFVHFMDTSGLLDAIDKQNLVRGSLLEAAGTSAGIGGKLGKVAELSRKVGFDLGEAISLIGHGAAVFDKRVRDGKSINNIRDMREMHSELRAISYEMNAAGDMVYNLTSPALVFQFAQVAHKGWLQGTNRRIAPRLRNRMFLWDMFVFGPPARLAAAIIGTGIIANSDVAEAITDGALGTTYNAIWSALTGEKQRVDYSALDPRNTQGIEKMAKTILTDGGYLTVISNSPAGQLFLKDTGKVQSAIGNMARFFNPWSDIDRTPQSALATALKVMEISSGASNAFKARQAWVQGKALDAMGVQINDSVTNHEALMMIAGFSPKDVKNTYELQIHAGERTKEYSDHVKTAVKISMKYYQDQLGLGITDPKQLALVTGELMQAFGDSPVALEIIQKELEKAYLGKDVVVLNQLVKLSGFPSTQETIAKIRTSGLPQDQIDTLVEQMEDYEKKTSEIRKNMKED